MIKCHLSRLMGERRLKVVDVASSVGVHRNAITLLFNDTANRQGNRIKIFVAVSASNHYPNLPFAA
jgi:DNA-binding Xre family transcriptional regulator